MSTSKKSEPAPAELAAMSSDDLLRQMTGGAGERLARVGEAVADATPAVRWRKVHPKAKAPEMVGGSIVLFSRLDDPLFITSGSTYPVPTGVEVEVPPGYEAVLSPCAPCKEAARGVILGNSGAIFQGRSLEVAAILSNMSRGHYTVGNGERLCVLSLRQATPVTLHEVKDFDSTN